MLRGFANRYASRRDGEVWGRIRTVWPAPLVPLEPVGWLHAVESRDPRRADEPVRGILLGSTRFLFFDAGEWMEWYPIARLVGLDWAQDGSELNIDVAHPTEPGVAHKHSFALDVPGQDAAAGEKLRHKFIGTLVEACHGRGQITVDDLWPPGGSPGIGLEEAPR